MKIEEQFAKMDLILNETDLEILKAKHGDNDLAFQVTDHYSRFGEDMRIDLEVGDTEKGSSWWNGCRTRDGLTTLEFRLEKSEGKNPKITFRTK